MHNQLLVCDGGGAVNFLQKFAPSAPWTLTAIWPKGIAGKPVSKSSIYTRTFMPDDAEACKAWVEEMNNGGWNMYFMPNPARRAMNKKAQKTDIKEVQWLFVDIDPDEKKVPEEERARIAKLLTTELPEGVPSPTLIIDSGGGMWGFWKLEQPLTVDEKANDSMFAALEAHNVRLEKLFGADSCHNIDRIARLPGSVNRPDEKKLKKKGRKPALARVIISNPELTYPISMFPPHIVPAHAAVNVPLVEIGEEQPLSDIYELDNWHVPERIKLIIQHGRIAGDTKDSDDSDSAWLFDAVCGLVRAGVPDGKVVSIIKDQRFAVSAHVRKYGSKAHAYAVRQWQRAAKAVAKGESMAWDLVKKNGEPRASYNNARVAIQVLGVVCEYDTFRNRKKVGGNVLQEYQGELTDQVVAMLRQLIFDEFGFDPFKEHVRDALDQLCMASPFNPVKEYLHGLEWDGTARLDTFIHRYFGAPDTPLNAAIGRKMLIAAVQRILHPGSKYDVVVVLEGKQGTGKSTALKILAGKEYFSDQDILSLDAKTQMECIEGVWIYEICELSGMYRSELNKVKAFVSRDEDHGRPAYGRFKENRPRQCIFVGTTNDDDYLRDPTGNRRYLPVSTGEIDLEALKADRDQLWAEAAHAQSKGEECTLPSDLWAAAAHQQSARLEEDLWEGLLVDVKGTVVDGLERITAAEILTNYLEIPKERWKKEYNKRIGVIMRLLGWIGPKAVRVPGHEKPIKGYTRVYDGPNNQTPTEDSMPF